MNIRRIVVPQEGRFIHRLLVDAGRASLYAAAIVGAIAAVLALVSEPISQHGAPSAPIVSEATASPGASAAERFEYFPDLYQNQAKQVEEPIATF